MVIIEERVAEKEGNAIFNGVEWRLFVHRNASKAKGVYRE
jgi:hypothetical protein